ncbi:MAG: NAD-dependent epimerase/dehydratase family protein [Betaproteobacteria bacterium]
MSGKSALLAGATGLVGGCVLRRLLAHPSYSRVEILLRRESPIRDSKLSQRIVDFANLQPGVAGNAPDEVFCCLGTTIRKAGSQEAFRRVDHDYPLALARFAAAAGAGKFLMVSALGADPKSALFYNRVKGEVEQAIAAVGLPTPYFFRPSLLLGARAENRSAEKVGIAAAKLLAPLLVGGLRKYRPIHADSVAAAMIHVANHLIPAGVIESDAIARIAALES